MKPKSFKKAFIAAAIIAAPIMNTQAASDPTLTYTFPDHVSLGGGVKQKTVDGALLNKQLDQNGKIVKLKITCKFAEALDPNNQKFCHKNQKLPGVYKSIRHYAVSHKTCRKQFGQIETRSRQIAGDTNIEKDVNRLAGKGWQNASYCPLTDARNQLMQKYRELGLTAN